MNVMGIIFANDATMGELTSKRTMASLPFAGRYRHVDFHLSNMAHAGIRHIGIISRHSYQSLMNHIGSGEEWGLELEEAGLEFLTPFAMSTSASYRGKLENLYYAINFMRYGPEDELVVMADSAVISNMDLNKVLAAHVASGKELTVVTKDGVCNGQKVIDLALKVGEDGKILDMAVDYEASSEYVASMDTFVMSKQWLMEQVKEHVAHNMYHMDRDLVMGLWQRTPESINVYPFEGVALFNESVEEYFQNSMALINKEVRHNLFAGAHPIYTKVRDRVPTYYGANCEVEDCIIADGCMIDGEVENSILFRQVNICEGAEVEHCVVMNDAVIGEGAELKYVILDKNVTVKPGTKICGTPEKPFVVKRGKTV